MKEEVIRKYVKNLDGLIADLGGGVSGIFVADVPSEDMVIFLFGSIFKHLNMKDILIKDEKKGELDAQALMDDEKTTIIIEFEARSRDFKTHKHDPNICNLIVCWEHNWQDAPENIDILELRYFWEKANMLGKEN